MYIYIYIYPIEIEARGRHIWETPTSDRLPVSFFINIVAFSSFGM